MTYAGALRDRIVALCKEKKITENRLATLSGLNQSTVNNITCGNTKSAGLRTLHLLAQGFGMTLSKFLDCDEFNNGLFDDE
jgi:transcriptional regulator with XRE-family HTH domain